MSENKARKVKEIFSDYQARANIIEAEILNLDVIKKTNTLGITIKSDEYIEVKEIWYFEKFLLERFGFKNIDMRIQYLEGVQLKRVDDEWRNIICYMAHKYPLMKPMLLMKSTVELEENIIHVKMHIRGADFLRAKKTDIELENVIKKLFGKEYKIKLEEVLQKEEELAYEKKMKELEEKTIEEMCSYNPENKEEKHNKEQEYNDPDYIPPQDGDIYIPEGMAGEMPEDIPQEGNIPAENYIMGKPSKAKEKHMKIKDITANDGRVTLEGRIVTCECRETKSGKGMIIYELYDGTGVITCKSFAKDAKEGQEITEKIKNAKAIKTVGKAGLDTYAGDITVISNTIIETETDVPEMPEEADEDTPLILGKNMNITAPLVKVADLGADDGQVSLDGEIIYMEDREL